MEREELIGRINKLFALAGNNPNEAEALSAALKAQKLMVDYDIAEEELLGKEARHEIIEHRVDVKSKSAMYGILANCIAEKFRCKAFLTCWYGGEKVASFYGYETDASAAAQVFGFLFKVMDKKARAARYKAVKLVGSSSGVYNSFCHGFIRGVRSELEKQCQELMIITPKEIEDSWEEFSANLARARGPRMDYNPYNKKAQEDGFFSGKSTLQSTRLGGQVGLPA